MHNAVPERKICDVSKEQDNLSLVKMLVFGAGQVFSHRLGEKLQIMFEIDLPRGWDEFGHKQ